MAGNEHARAALDRFAPRTHIALQTFVMAMTDVVKNAGKKSLFGRDKGADSYERFLRSMIQTVQAMLQDNQVNEANTSDEVLQKLVSVMELFRSGYPNWPEAYLYFTWMISDNRPRTVEMVNMALNRTRQP